MRSFILKILTETTAPQFYSFVRTKCSDLTADVEQLTNRHLTYAIRTLLPSVDPTEGEQSDEFWLGNDALEASWVPQSVREGERWAASRSDILGGYVCDILGRPKSTPGRTYHPVDSLFHDLALVSTSWLVLRDLVEYCERRGITDDRGAAPDFSAAKRASFYGMDRERLSRQLDTWNDQVDQLGPAFRRQLRDWTFLRLAICFSLPALYSLSHKEITERGRPPIDIATERAKFLASTIHWYTGTQSSEDGWLYQQGCQMLENDDPVQGAASFLLMLQAAKRQNLQLERVQRNTLTDSHSSAGPSQPATAGRSSEQEREHQVEAASAKSTGDGSQLDTDMSNLGLKPKKKKKKKKQKKKKATSSTVETSHKAEADQQSTSVAEDEFTEDAFAEDSTGCDSTPEFCISPHPTNSGSSKGVFISPHPAHNEPSQGASGSSRGSATAESIDERQNPPTAFSEDPAPSQHEGRSGSNSTRQSTKPKTKRTRCTALQRERQELEAAAQDRGESSVTGGFASAVSEVSQRDELSIAASPTDHSSSSTHQGSSHIADMVPDETFAIHSAESQLTFQEPYPATLSPPGHDDAHSSASHEDLVRQLERAKVEVWAFLHPGASEALMLNPRPTEESLCGSSGEVDESSDSSDSVTIQVNHESWGHNDKLSESAFKSSGYKPKEHSAAQDSIPQ